MHRIMILFPFIWGLLLITSILNLCNKNFYIQLNITWKYFHITYEIIRYSMKKSWQEIIKFLIDMLKSFQTIACLIQFCQLSKTCLMELNLINNSFNSCDRTMNKLDRLKYRAYNFLIISCVWRENELLFYCKPFWK